MKTNLIQWPRAKYWDKPWNPIIGCHAASPACDNCYARALVTGRFNTTGICAPGFVPTETKRVNPPRKGVVFCGNLTDLFGEWVARPGDYLARTLGSVGDATYLWLTKRPSKMADTVRLFSRFDMTNHFFGITAENGNWFESRWPEFGMMPAWSNLWLSAEPLLGPLDIGDHAPVFNWVVVGCESGPNRRPCKIEWVESIVEQCRSAGVPVFVKQLDLGGKCVTDIKKFPKHLQIRQVPWNRRAGEESK